MKTDEILKKLRDAGGYVSGQELCEYYGVSRTAIWKAIKQLEKEGYTIEAQNNKGYRLVEDSGIDVFSKVEIESHMDTKWIGRNLIFRKETASTNLDAKKLADEGADTGSLVVADMQTAGRGRRGRDWISPAGKDIYMTLMLRPECRPEKASALTLVMALAVLEAIREFIQPSIQVGIKWPNDIVINNKKTCGILTEMSAELDGIHYVVIGVGINVNQTAFADDISKTATSMFIENGEKINRSKLVARVMHYFEEDYEIFANTWDLTGLVDKYNKYLVNCGKEVRVLDPKGEYDALAEGINENGELIVKRKDNGETCLVYAGEVSVRGVYGYAI
jgi:BirA family biotin operon repressor/biotin-[acetyl-CoA-carboxylase] ligase